MDESRNPGEAIKPRLSLFDAVCIIVGIVIGTTIYQSPPFIDSNLPGPWATLAVWAVAGVLVILGALCYAELATTYPGVGGDYVYLSRAFGPWLGFLFGWAQLGVIITASTGAMAFVFGNYAVRLWGEQVPAAVYAVAAVVGLSVLNLLGVVMGKWTQNLLSLLKVVGLGSILVAGFGFGQTQNAWVAPEPAPGWHSDYGLAMILVLYAYGGWNDSVFVAAEVRKRRSMALALILGTVGITLIYVAINAAYINGLGFEGVRKSDAVAADVLRRLPGEYGEKAERIMSLLVMISALGAINGLIFTGSRVYTRLGSEHRIFALLGRWNHRLGSPVWSLLAQLVVTLLMVGAVGFPEGRGAINSALGWLGLDPIEWKNYGGGFETLVTGSAPTFWAFFLLSGLSLFALRQKDPHIERPFPVPFYPVVPLIFCGTCLFMLYRAIKYTEYLAVLGVVPMLLGLVLYLVSGPREGSAEPADAPFA
jgi:basic amino acid/polyamine antiporter, APA family